MKSIVIGVGLVLFLASSAHAGKNRQWQEGTLRAAGAQDIAGGTIGVPLYGGGFVAVPLPAQQWLYLTIEGTNGFSYSVKRPVGRKADGRDLIVNDPVSYAIEKDRLFVRRPDAPHEEYWFLIVTRTRLPR